MTSETNNYVINETTEILIDLGPMKDTVHQVSNQPSSSLITSTYAQKISPRLLHVCYICDKMCISRVSLAKHFAKHNVVAVETTEYQTSSGVDHDSEPNPSAENAVNKDQEKVTAPGKLSCDYCEKSFGNQTDLTTHIQYLHYLYDGLIMEVHCCGYCGVRFSRRNDLFHHIKCCGTLSIVDNCKLANEIILKSNSNKQLSESVQPSTQVEYFCLNCKQKCSFKIISLDYASKILKLNCQTCEKPLHLTYFIPDSIKVVEPQKTVDYDTTNVPSLTNEPCQNSKQLTSIQFPLVTNDVDKITNKEDSLDKIAIIDQEKTITKPKTALKKFYHVVRKFNKNLKFKCNICYEKLSSLDLLNNHFNSVHVGIRKQKCNCPYCSMSYITAKLYLRHLQSHVRLKKISCHYQLLSKPSSQPFYNISDYQNTDKQYTCLHCSERFSNSVEILNHHKESHPRISVHACQVCSCQFVSNKSLRKHLKKHSVKNFYKCDFCFKMFTKMSIFLPHILQHAKISF